MTEIFSFLLNHWFYAALLLLTLILFIQNEQMVSSGGAPRLTPEEAVFHINHHKATVVDLREPAAFHQGHILNAVSMPLDKIEKEIAHAGLAKENPIILVCATGQQSGKAVKTFKKNSFMLVYVMTQGMQGWLNANMPIVKLKK